MCLYVLAIFLPPIAVFCSRGCGMDFFLNLIGCILFFPAQLHACCIVSGDIAVARDRQQRGIQRV